MDESLIEKQNGNFGNTLLGAVLLKNLNKMNFSNNPKMPSPKPIFIVLLVIAILYLMLLFMPS